MIRLNYAGNNVRCWGGKMTEIPIEYVIKLGMLRVKNKCAVCDKVIDIKNYHIQLCKKCRMKYLKENLDKL